MKMTQLQLALVRLRASQVMVKMELETMTIYTAENAETGASTAPPWRHPGRAIEVLK